MARLWFLLIAVVAPVTLVALVAPVSLLPQTKTAMLIQGVELIDGRGGPPAPNTDILIEGETVQAIGPPGSLSSPAGASRLDGRGLSALPGLADLHVHLQGGWDGHMFDMLRFQTYLNAFLYNGVTTILDTGNHLPFVTEQKKAVAGGRITGPQIFSCGPMFDGPDIHWPFLGVAISSRGQIGPLVAECRKYGVDLLKAYSNLSDQNLGVLVAEAKKEGLRVIIDAWDRNLSRELALSGIAGFAHVGTRHLITDEEARLIAERGVFVISTLAVYECFTGRRLAKPSFLDQPLIREVIPPEYLEEMRKPELIEKVAEEVAPLDPKVLFENGKENLRRLRRAGVLLAAGTDTPYPGVLQGESLHRELELLVEAGFTPLDAISMATANAARVLGRKDCGTLEPGKRADLLLVRGNPSKNIGETRNIAWIIQGGRILARESLAINSDQAR